MYYIDTILGGCVIGYILAEQQTSAERVAWPYSQTSPENFGHLISSSIAGLRTGARSVAFAVLIIVAALPPSVWSSAMFRLQGLKAGGVEVTLAPASGRRGGEIEEGRAPPNSAQIGGPENILLRGFSDPRIQRLQQYTYSPTISIEGTRRAMRWEAPARNLHYEAQYTIGCNSNEVVHIQRDRAYMALLHMGENARFDTSPPRKLSQNPLGQFASVGRSQEYLLSIMRPAVKCFEDYISRTRDRRMVQIDSYAVVRSIVLLSRSWMNLESKIIEESMNQPRSVLIDHRIIDSISDHLDRVVERGMGLADGIDRLQEELGNVVYAWDGDYRSTACWIETGARLRVMFSQMRPHRIESQYNNNGINNHNKMVFEYLSSMGFLEGGFSPYLSVFAAIALSGVGDHEASIHLLLEWLNRSFEVSNRLMRDRAHDTGARELMTTLNWHALQVAAEIGFLQSLANLSGDVRGTLLAPSVSVFRHMVEERFRAVFGLFGEGSDIIGWRMRGGQKASECRKPEHRWRQPLIRSYATYVQNYLELRNRSFFSPGEVSARDLELADLLSELDIACFEDIADGATLAGDRVRFVLASIEIRMNQLIDEPPRRLSSGEQAALLRRLLGELDRLEQYAKEKLPERTYDSNYAELDRFVPGCANGDVRLCVAFVAAGDPRPLARIQAVRSRLERIRRQRDPER
ncbi:hypothetical protein GXW77_20015 [Roseomonas alkaliterrae]|uniref:Uncharacterized protein n=1 Tax=Neoroseomonas alkaliterrae TaxID=1452450 RepID=A0A840Y7B5_9PROT|nr:hypothetical protein [Neoroseomonas alkaliterrae]MBB5691841.1 hypothetical protein [Neoroseomonas alkaliterrae]MBR0678460.1 hypothetical protein [Neoroseomonas alkaliterrae]